MLFMWYSPQANVSLCFSWATTHRTYKVGQQINADVHHLNEFKKMFLLSAQFLTLRIVLD